MLACEEPEHEEQLVGAERSSAFRHVRNIGENRRESQSLKPGSDVMKGGDASSAAAKLEVVQFSGPSGQDREFCIEETKL